MEASIKKLRRGKLDYEEESDDIVDGGYEKY